MKVNGRQIYPYIQERERQADIHAGEGGPRQSYIQEIEQKADLHTLERPADRQI